MALSKQSCPANTRPSHPLHFAPRVPSLCEWEPEGVHLLPLPYWLNQVTKEGRLQTMALRWQGKCLLETENLLSVSGVPAKSLQSCPTLCDPMDGRPPGSSVHGILQAGKLKWAATPSSGDLLNPRIEPTVSCLLPQQVGFYH